MRIAPRCLSVFLLALLLASPAARERELVLKSIYRMTESLFPQYWISKVLRAQATSVPKIVYSNEKATELVNAIPGFQGPQNRRQAARREPLFGDVGLLHGPVTGTRYDFSEFAAFKLEYNRTMRREPDAINALRKSVSFTF